ncbi:MAG: hypothetical protein H3C38_00490 [Rhodospirillales bacterium]|nr:hypothetical protein [Rhodospirillales bacterium]
MANHAMRLYRVTIHATDGRSAPHQNLIATNPGDAMLEALQWVGRGWRECIGRIEVEEAPRN